MKAITTCLLLCLLTAKLQAQDRKTILKLNVFGFFGSQAQPFYDRVTDNPIDGFFANQYQIACEHVIKQKQSVQLSAGYIGARSSQQLGYNKYTGRLNGFILIPEYRFYFSKRPAPARFYTAVFVRYRKTVNELTDESPDLSTGGINVSRRETSQAIGGGITLGYQFMIGKAKRFALDVFMGPQFKERTSGIIYRYPEGNDNEFSSKFISVRVSDRSGPGLRFGINLGYAF